MNIYQNFPKQKLARSQKTISWGKSCLDALESYSHLSTHGVRQSYHNKKINYDLANDILHHNDVERTTNPYGLENFSFPAKMQNYPIALPKIDLLVGEEYKRDFDFVVRLMNSDSVGQKQKELMDFAMQKVTEMIQSKDLSKEEAEKRLESLQKYALYNYQDVKEKNAADILKFYRKQQDFKDKFNKGFYDALISGEELYCVDLIVGEPVLRKVNPLQLTAIRGGNSPHLEDAELIIEDDYYPIGKVIDTYWDMLTDAQVKSLERGTLGHGPSTAAGSINIGEREPTFLPGGTFVSADDDHVIEYDPTAPTGIGTTFDSEGNIRVMRGVWKSFRKIGILNYFDQETGEPLKKFIDESYKPVKEEGENVDWKWVSEWWEGTKIGYGKEAIYIKVQPRPVQLRKHTTGNYSICNSGYVGTYYNINSSKAMSLMDRLKPFQYLFNALTYRLEIAFAKSHGKLMRLPLHEIPDHLSMDEYLSYALGTGILPYNAFQEAKKGAATGKLAGNMQQNNLTVDMEQGAYIAQHLQTLQWLKEEVGEIAGVSRQRQSQISSQEAVGNVQRSIIQSSHITEKWFRAHTSTKKRVLQTFLETAQYALRNNKLKRQFVTDDLRTTVMEIHPDMPYEELGIITSNESSDLELMNELKEMLKVHANNDRFRLSTFMEIYRTESMQDMQRKIEQVEQAQDEAAERQEQAKIDAMKEEAQRKEAIEREKIQVDREQTQSKERAQAKTDAANIRTAEIRSFSFQKDQDSNDNNVPDQLEIEKLKLESRELDITEKDLALKRKKENSKTNK